MYSRITAPGIRMGFRGSADCPTGRFYEFERERPELGHGPHIRRKNADQRVQKNREKKKKKLFVKVGVLSG